MNRRGFLKGLGILTGASLIPDWFGKKNPAESKNMTIKAGSFNPKTCTKEPEYDFKKAGEEAEKAFIKKWKASESLASPEFRTKNFKEYWYNEEYRYGAVFYISAEKFYYPNYGNKQ